MSGRGGVFLAPATAQQAGPAIHSIRARAGNWVVTIAEVGGREKVYQACLARVLYDISTAVKFGWSEEQALGFGLKATGENNVEIKGFFPHYELGIGHGASFWLAVRSLQHVLSNKELPEKDAALAVLINLKDLVWDV